MTKPENHQLSGCTAADHAMRIGELDRLKSIAELKIPDDICPERLEIIPESICINGEPWGEYVNRTKMAENKI
ncbi:MULTISPECIES: hypothetical protein [Pantoea]|uniref:hypothetical protein n=1 Tax=Pantoea TaxID=53335 RepID=UPI00257BC813|nr:MULTISPECIES: hypothetical protein [Pantoea]